MATTTPTGVRGGHAKHGGTASPDGAPMTHRQIMEALTGLLLGIDRKSTRQNSSHNALSRMPSSA